MTTPELIRWAINLAVPAIAGFVGVIVGAWLTTGREKRQRQLAFLEKQLTLFYSPMIGLRNEVKMHGILRERIQGTAEEAWTQLTKESDHLSIEEKQKLTTEGFAPFKRLIEFDNAKLTTALIPAYKKMLALFREQYWLIDPETRKFYEELAEFLEIWERWLDKSLPVEVLQRLDHSEENLKSFYAQIEKVHDEIRAKIKAGEAV